MNRDEKYAALQQVLQVTLDMQNKLQPETWDEVIILDQQRQVLLAKIFPIEMVDLPIKVLIEKILDLNKLIEAQCKKEKDEVQQQLSGMNKNKRAMSAYLIS